MGDHPAGHPASGTDRNPPDVFLSYKREDLARAEWVYDVLKARGWTVWFDRQIDGGTRWRRLIDETLDHVGCVVVLWSSASVASTWVMDEAGEGMERGVLVPALLDDVEIPIGFREAQAIDMVEARVSPEQAEAALVAAVASILDRPPVEPTRPTRTGRLLRREGPLVAAILPVAVALPLLLRPAATTVIDLDVMATQVSFVSAREQDLTDRMELSSFDAVGLESIHLPRTRASDERIVSGANGRAPRLRLATDAESTSPGSITLESVRVPERTRVELAVPESRSLRVSLYGTSSPVSMSVFGPLRTDLGAGDLELLDYGTPKPISIAPDARGVDVVLRGLEPDGRIVSGPLRIEELSLVRIDQTLETTRTELAAVSTIRSGTVRVDAPGGRERTIGAGERLRLSASAGEIRDLVLADDVLRARFLGSVRSLDSCTADDECESWMPSTLESFVARRLPSVLVIAGLYVLVLVALTRRRFRRAGRIAMIAIAFAAAGFTGASARTTTRVQDPEESVKRIVVRVESPIGFGSGIIIGVRSDTLFVATANHVVRRGPTAADSLDVRFYWQPDVPVRATLLPFADDSLDLAVMAVSPLSAVPADRGFAPSTAAATGFDPRIIPFDRLGDLNALERGDPIWLLGQPNGLPWRINTSPERFIGFRDQSLDFESNLLARGHSGGALLNESREVIGMLKSDRAPYGEAVSMYAIARTLEDRGIPVDLQLRPPQLQAGEGRTCVLGSTGATRCIGYDDRWDPGPLEFGVRLRQLSLRDDHACGIATGGRAFCVGPNGNGQLGDGTTTSRYASPAAVAGGLDFESISAGSGHTCGIVAGGDVYCWGLAEGGQLGSGFAEDRTSPTRVPTTERFRSVSAMWQYTCALTVAGGARCWGSVAGALFFRGSPVEPVAPDLTFGALSAGWNHVCAITHAGEAWCWGFNDRGQLGSGTTDDDYHEQPIEVMGDHVFTSITAGAVHTCGLTTDREAWCWGGNNFGQLGNGTTVSSARPVRVSGNHTFEAVSAGARHTCGLTSEGQVWCWGDNEIVGSHEGGGVLPDGDAQYDEPVLSLSLDPAERRPWRRPRSPGSS